MNRSQSNHPLRGPTFEIKEKGFIILIMLMCMLGVLSMYVAEYVYPAPQETSIIVGAP